MSEWWEAEGGIAFVATDEHPGGIVSDTPWTPGPWGWAASRGVNDPDYPRVVPGEAASFKVGTDADARLIAAAPEMAELLERALRTMLRSDEPWVTDSRALLARIKGEP